MSVAAIGRMLRVFGLPLVRHRAGESVGVSGFGLIQPVLERRERGRQYVPSPLGLVRQERFLYWGEPSLHLTQMQGGYLLCEGLRYQVLSAQAMYVGRHLTHWRAVLCVDEEGLP